MELMRVRRNELKVGMRVKSLDADEDVDCWGVVKVISGTQAGVLRDDGENGCYSDNNYSDLWLIEVKHDNYWGANEDSGYLYTKQIPITNWKKVLLKK